MQPPSVGRIPNPDHEQLLRENPELIAQIEEGIAEAEAGQTVYLGSFAQYLDDEPNADKQSAASS